MSGKDIFFLLTQLLGGLALFIYGMSAMSEGLQRAAGNRLRDLLYHLTRNKLAALGIGTLVGFLVHSSAGTVMVVGFITAGLMTLGQAIAVILGANLGTTFSMQVISFKLDDYCYLLAAVGLLLWLVAGRRPVLKHTGYVLLGFGLLLLGMRTMSGAVGPLRGGTLQEFLQHTEATTLLGMLAGVLVSTFVTGVIQSSGAMVGILFALSQGGVFTEFSQVFPLLLGAHIGTCATALLGSIGTNIEARRAAVAHLLFNVLGTILAIAAMRFYLWLIPLTSDDLMRQIANAHTHVQLFNALIFLPFTAHYARLVARLTPSRSKPPEKSHLEERCLSTPEMAIVAALRESQRMARLTLHQLTQAMRGLVEMKSEPFLDVRKTEEAVDTIKDSIRDFLVRLASHDLTQRQSILTQHILSSVADIERIGDHATVLVELTEEKVQRNVWFDDASMEDLLQLYTKAKHVLELTCESLESQMPVKQRQELASAILQARNDYVDQSKRMKEANLQLVRTHREDALTGLIFSRYVACLDKVVKHSKLIAIAELAPVFFVKEYKLDRKSELVERPPLPKNGGFVVDKSIFEE